MPGSGNCARVDGVLASRLLGHHRSDRALRLLLALSQRQSLRTTELEGVSHATLKDGLALATVRLGPSLRWRAGRVTIEGRSIPDSVAHRLGGHGIATLVEHPELRGAVIRRARNSREGVEVAVDLADMDYASVWRRLGG